MGHLDLEIQVAFMESSLSYLHVRMSGWFCSIPECVDMFCVCVCVCAPVCPDSIAQKDSNLFYVKYFNLYPELKETLIPLIPDFEFQHLTDCSFKYVLKK